MKKEHILNAELIRQIAQIGHTQTLVICDAGLPIPPGITCIDLAVVRGVPTLPQVLQAVLSELVVEGYAYATEVKGKNRMIFDQMQALLSGVQAEEISHAEFKRRCADATVIIRTGECSPYANIILTAGVNF